MPNFGLPLLLNWRLLRKTSYLKIKGLCGTVIYNLQKRSWKGCKNRATRRQTGELPNNEPTTGTTAATRPFPAKKKATPLSSAAETELPPCFTNSKASFLSIASIRILLPLLPLRSALSLLPLLSLRSALTVVFELLWLT